MSMRQSAAAIVQAARSTETNRLASRQSEQAIARSIKLLRLRVYPDDQEPRTEQ